jgi:hypothetical protein
MAVSNDEIVQRVFNPNEHLMDIKSKEGKKPYLPVQWRLVWFRSQYPQGVIETSAELLDLQTEYTVIESKWNKNRNCYEDVPKTAKGIAIFKAKVSDGIGGSATGTKSEMGASFPDFIEKAETGAIGRALAALGYGTQFTGDEWDEAHRIVDSPVCNTEPKQSDQQSQRPTPVKDDPSAKVAQGIQKSVAEQKQRALDNKLIQNDEQWQAVLDYIQIKEFKTGKDVYQLRTGIDQMIRDAARQPVEQATA